MIKVAMVAQSGEVAYTVSPAVDDMYVDGQVYNEHTARHISHESVDREVVETWYWKDGWQTRNAKPSVFHDWVDESWQLNSERLWIEIRMQRFYKLSECDWTQVSDNQLTDAKKAEWATYRQALRNVPANNSDATDLSDIIWPTKPE